MAGRKGRLAAALTFFILFVMLLFLYGTLKRGGSNHHFMKDQRWVANARTQPAYRLYDLGGYPGMVASTEEGLSIEGEIWDVDAAALARLDELEDVAGGEYAREPVALLPPHQGLEVQGYRFLLSVTGKRELGTSW